LQEPKDDEPRGLSRDISDSLRGIDALGEPEQKAPPKRRFGLFRRKRDRDRNRASERTGFQKWRKRITVLLILVVLVGVGYMAAKVIANVSKITHGDLLSLITPGTPLNTDGQGRTNILIFGTSQDDAAHQNASGGGGLWLTDSIMVVSLNQTAHTVTMISIPRDLWVAMPNDCAVGDHAKINAVYECGADLLNSDDSAQKASGYAKQDKQGAQALQSTIQHVTGLSMQYYVHANYSVLQQAVDAVGGIQVHIQGDGASGIYDTNYDWD
jgi:LCP family protein required for cell wall assembly